MPYLSPYDYGFADSGDEADRRARFFRTVDPFPDVAPALLSCEHIAAYVRVTGMLHPFDPGPGQLKPASYEARPGKTFIYWDKDGRKLVTTIRPGQRGKFVLPENSITFMQIEPTIRLPDYIALRFNLRIKHVHRGLLLGTGPLVDPGFQGDLLIPLHNLTSDPYEIDQDEGLIWIEFTKTSRREEFPVRGLSPFHEIERHKTDVRPEVYFERASNNNPIRSSIPLAIKEARDKADASETSAKKALRASKLFAGVGLLTIAGSVLGITLALHSYFGQINSNVIATNQLAGSVNAEALRAGMDAATAQDENHKLQTQLGDATRRIDLLESELKQITTKLDALRRPGKR